MALCSQAVRGVEDCFWTGHHPAAFHPLLARIPPARERCLGGQPVQQEQRQGDRPPLLPLLAQVYSETLKASMLYRCSGNCSPQLWR